MDPQHLNYLCTEAIRAMPQYEDDIGEDLSREQLEWQARTLAIVELAGSDEDVTSFRNAMHRARLGTSRFGAGQLLYQILLIILARTELKLPVRNDGAFISIGNRFDAHRAIRDIVADANHDLLVVDPYADESILLDYLHSTPRGTNIRILRDSGYPECGASLLSAARAWREQFKRERPIEIRSASRKSLHDRFIAKNGDEVFLISQSLKDLAKRSPATIQKANPLIAKEKIEAYEAIWDASQTSA